MDVTFVVILVVVILIVVVVLGSSRGSSSDGASSQGGPGGGFLTSEGRRAADKRAAEGLLDQISRQKGGRSSSEVKPVQTQAALRSTLITRLGDDATLQRHMTHQREKHPNATERELLENVATELGIDQSDVGTLY